MWATPDVARAGPTSARRRRERRIRSFFRHEKMALKLDHSSQRCCSVATQTGDGVPATVYAATASLVAACAASAASPMVEYVDPAPIVLAPVFGSVAPAPAVTYSAPAPVFEYVAPAPVFEFAPAPAGSFVAASQQLRPAFTAAAVTTGVNLDADFVGSASQVVGSLPHGEVFAGPGFYQVHHEHIAAVPAVTEFFPMSDDEGGELSAGLRPAPLWEPLPQERIQRHTAEQMIESFVPVPMFDLDALVPQMVDQLVDVLKLFDNSVPEQVIDVPKISQDAIPQRTVLCDPQLAEQLVEVPTPVPPSVLFIATDGHEWCRISGPTGVYFWRTGTQHTQWRPPEGYTASPGRYRNTGQR